MLASIMSPEVTVVFDQARSPQTRRVTVGDRTVEILTPFPSPEDWRDQWIYFLLVDRFNNPQAPPRFAPFDGQHGVFQGGTFNGVRQQLDYLRQLGVGAIWLSPVLKNCQYNPFTFHGYGIQDLLQVDPRFASDPQAARANPQLAEDELRALVDEAHTRGIYVTFDIVLNHVGDAFEYVLDDGTRVANSRSALGRRISSRSARCTTTRSRSHASSAATPRKRATSWASMPPWTSRCSSSSRPWPKDSSPPPKSSTCSTTANRSNATSSVS